MEIKNGILNLDILTDPNFAGLILRENRLPCPTRWHKKILGERLELSATRSTI